MNDTSFKKNVKAVMQQVGGGEIGYLEKKALGSTMKRILGAVAENMGLAKGDFDVRYNAGGPAVKGDGVLHSDNLYVSMSPDSAHTGILVRSCNGRKDYTGGANNFISWETFSKFQGAGDFSREVGRRVPTATKRVTSALPPSLNPIKVQGAFEEREF